MTDTFRIPTPMLFGAPLLFFFREQIDRFVYRRELWALVIAVFFYYVIGLSEFRSFVACAITITICALYFHYFVGYNKSRFNFSVIVFVVLLAISSVIMVVNHYYSGIDDIRTMLMGEQVLQSPSGIAVSQFTFGYQLAALVGFILISTFVYHRHFVVKAAVFFACLIFIYLGLQRSVFITFSFSVFLFLLFYYRVKGLLVIAVGIAAGIMFYNYILDDYLETDRNILTKEVDDKNPENNRILLTTENLNIYSNYPLGLVFYGKTWSDVIYRNHVFASGISSHNAYLMFLTYLGPFLGLGLLILIYSSVLRIGYYAIKEIRLKENALLICLVFSFLSISMNALSHNAWLVSADGPTVFLYFSILHFYTMKKNDSPRELQVSNI